MLDFFFQAEDGIRGAQESRGLGDVYKRQFQGLDDMVVPPSQSEMIVAALSEKGIECEYHAYEGEGHGFRKSENIEHMYKAIDRFLRQWVIFS